MAAKKTLTPEQKKAKELARIVTPVFRVSYPHVFKPNQVKPSDKPKYSITMLIPKDADLTKIKAAMKNAKIAAFGPNKADWPEDLESPVVDGDAPKFKDKEGYKGHYAIKATSNEDSKPVVVDQQVNPIVNQADFYAGCYAKAHVYAYVWEYMGKQGIGFIVDHIQKVRDGKSFGGKKPVEEVFSAIESEDADGFDDADDDTAEMDFG